MRKIVLVTFLIMASAVNAQFVEFGVKGGANFSNIEGDIGGINFGTRTGYHLGILAEIKLLGNLSLQPEALFSSIGAEVKEGGFFNKFDWAYVDVPVMLKLYIFPDKLTLEVGPRFGILTDNNLGNVIETKSFDFSLSGGIGINLTKSLFVQARYIVGITEFSKEPGLKNNNIQISAGLKF